jgi:lysophospholipase L1-like esterase
MRIFVAVLLNVALALPAAAQECAGMAAANTPAAYKDIGKTSLYEAEVRTIADQKTADMILIGDSLVEAWDVKLLHPRTAVNFGIVGDKTQNVLWRLNAPVLKNINPKDVVILLGTNNLGVGDEPCAIVSGLKRVLFKIVDLWPSARLWVLEIPPRGPDFAFRNDDRKQVNASLRQVLGMHTINVDDEITCHWHQPCENYLDDNLHFSPLGYSVLADALNSAIH